MVWFLKFIMGSVMSFFRLMAVSAIALLAVACGDARSGMSEEGAPTPALDVKNATGLIATTPTVRENWAVFSQDPK